VAWHGLWLESLSYRTLSVLEILESDPTARCPGALIDAVAGNSEAALAQQKNEPSALAARLKMPVLKPLSGNPNAPQQYKQPSRKGKKAWRKNVDISEVQQGLEELNDQIIKGYVSHTCGSVFTC